MSLSGALSNALSGLTANARAATLVSSNISNALTDGYARRELATSSNGMGFYGGVRVDGVTRSVNPVILADRRLSDAEAGRGEQLQSFASRIELMVGDATESGSLSGRMAALENALITAASNPSSTQRLDTVSRAAEDLAKTFNSLSDGIQTARQDADRAISFQVDSLNDTLEQVEALNTRITRALVLGRDPSSLMDLRQKAIDTVAEAVPVRTVTREDGGIAVFTTGGVTLVDGKAATIEFSNTAIIVPHMTQANGLLSGLTINGKAVDTSANSQLAGGSLGAQFQIRDQDAVAFQAQLDGVARDAIERLGPGGPDGTLTATDPGVFMDAGSAFVATDEIGISGRITLNPIVSVNGGETWRLRDGLGAAATGEVGDSSLLNGIYDTLTQASTPTSSSLDPTARSLSGLVSEWASGVGAFRVRQDGQLSYAQAQNVALTELELAEGVDTDQELQLLMLLEQNYQANAKVMTTVDQMLQSILAI
ncbi:flagellar hook-associated protein FlgK [Puniceibacterium sediminis]|uniref:Flagellar hook-associated protein 1 n=1 Tax=Puniceibacterium sediminis TaxID=1608407 RepID=A0A238VSB2_9RHOB|nr:flagellar hook-associated protein FlgK [Puniceibacterium sediminis]SNR37071.1 flagellar hook-associated protein 1 FlgK [Puniceibacterium sediminis]